MAEFSLVMGCSATLQLVGRCSEASWVDGQGAGEEKASSKEISRLISRTDMLGLKGPFLYKHVARPKISNFYRSTF